MVRLTAANYYRHVRVCCDKIAVGNCDPSKIKLRIRTNERSNDSITTYDIVKYKI